MIPPSSWLSASVGLMMRPESCALVMRRTRTRPVSMSTSTSANCAANAAMAVSCGLAPRLPWPMIITSPSFLPICAKVIVRSSSAIRTTLSRAVRRAASTSSSSAAASSSRARASSAATRTAGPTDAVVIEPHELPA